MQYQIVRQAPFFDKSRQFIEENIYNYFKFIDFGGEFISGISPANWHLENINATHKFLFLFN